VGKALEQIKYLRVELISTRITDNTSVSDTELVEHCIAGKRTYQEIFYNKFCRKMMGICFRYSRNKEEAEDILQEGFIKIFLNLKRFRNEGSLEGWVRRIMMNTIFETHRNRKKELRVVPITNEVEVSTEENYLNHSQTEEIISMLQDLPTGCRVIFNMFAIDGYTHKEIAQQLNISEGTSKSQYHAARQILKRKIEAQHSTIPPYRGNQISR
jgi:RNA polymerase sigma factor (sigma-70 family)